MRPIICLRSDARGCSKYCTQNLTNRKGSLTFTEQQFLTHSGVETKEGFAQRVSECPHAEAHLQFLAGKYRCIRSPKGAQNTPRH